MSEIQVLTNENFSTFLSIIQERGETPEDYYHWKFIQQWDNNQPVGLILKEDNVNLGCIGLLNYQMHIPEKVPIHANWFADWFVTDLARGKGIGKKLMESCAVCSDIGFGIPGPVHAQKVAGKAGYEHCSDFVELQIPIRPTIVGLKRFGGSLLKKSLRSLKLNLDFVSCFAFKRRKSIMLEWGQPSINCWNSICNRLLNDKTHFVRSESRLFHFLNMPINKDREWWYYETEDSFVTGFVETDIWGLKRTKIIDFVYDSSIYSDYSGLFIGILNALRKNKVDLVLTILSKEQVRQHLLVKDTWIQPIPLYKTLKNSIKLDYLSNLDKESAWRDLKF